MPKRLMLWLCLIVLMMGVACGTSDPIIARICAGFALGACLAMCLIERS